MPENHSIVTVSYKSRGYCIAVQGSELCHHVTPVEAADEDRMSFVISFHPGTVLIKTASQQAAWLSCLSSQIINRSKPIHIIKTNAFTEQWKGPIHMTEFNGHSRLCLIVYRSKLNAENKSSGFEFVRWTQLFADFEYFRQRAWMSKTILEDYVKNVQVDSDVQELEKKLRDVAAELTRTGLSRNSFNSAIKCFSADLLSGKISDQIGYYQDGKFVKF